MRKRSGRVKSSVSLAVDVGRLKIMHMVELFATSTAKPRNGGREGGVLVLCP